MRQFGLSSLALLCVSHAYAADLPPAVEYKAPATVVAERFSWTGVYVGVNGGYGGTRSTTSSAHGATVGGLIGANWQTGALVIGAEADAGWANVNRTFNISGIAPFVVTETLRAQIFGTARARAGVAFDRFLVYGTAGGAVLDVRHEGTGVVGVLGTYNQTNALLGWTAGGGAEWAFADHWSVKAEYLYARFSQYINHYATTIPAGTVTYRAMAADVVRAGVSYHF